MGIVCGPRGSTHSVAPAPAVRNACPTASSTSSIGSKWAARSVQTIGRIGLKRTEPTARFEERNATTGRVQEAWPLSRYSFKSAVWDSHLAAGFIPGSIVWCGQATGRYNPALCLCLLNQSDTPPCCGMQIAAFAARSSCWFSHRRSARREPQRNPIPLNLRRHVRPKTGHCRW
jgi:hypothetical protein